MKLYYFEKFLKIIFYICIIQTNYFIMKTLITLLFIIFLTGTEALSQEQQPVPYTLADRDRLIKVETEIGMNSLRSEMNSIRSEMNSLRNEMNAKFEAIDKQFVYHQKQIDDLKTLFYWGFGIMITLSIFMLGYIIWDRRTALKPAQTSAEEAKDKTRNLITALREYARSHPDMADILKTYGLL